jgi:DNA-binding winged helix-turn-helix (wHTH) protein
MQYVFGAYTLDVLREELRAAGSVVRLDRQVFAVLTYLVQHRDRVVPRQELFERLWSDRFVSDAALERCVTVARRAAGDSGRTQQVIQTVRGRGYRFVAPVEERPGEALHREVRAAPDDTTGLHEERWPAGPDTQEAERRQLTILVCQLVGVPEHAVPVDPEALVEVLPDYHLRCAEVVRRFSGHMAQDPRDGRVVVYFGYPQAQEDDACRAVYAGLEIVEAMRQFQGRRVCERGGRFAVRVGIHTGMVVMHARDPRDAQGPLALGQTPAIAAQVQGFAPPDTVAISPATMRLVEGYVLSQALGLYLLDDAPEPQGVFQVLQ